MEEEEEEEGEKGETRNAKTKVKSLASSFTARLDKHC